MQYTNNRKYILFQIYFTNNLHRVLNIKSESYGKKIKSKFCFLISRFVNFSNFIKYIKIYKHIRKKVIFVLLFGGL